MAAACTSAPWALVILLIQTHKDTDIGILALDGIVADAKGLGVLSHIVIPFLAYGLVMD